MAIDIKHGKVVARGSVQLGRVLAHARTHIHVMYPVGSTVVIAVVTATVTLVAAGGDSLLDTAKYDCFHSKSPMSCIKYKGINFLHKLATAKYKALHVSNQPLFCYTIRPQITQSV